VSQRLQLPIRELRPATFTVVTLVVAATLAATITLALTDDPRCPQEAGRWSRGGSARVIASGDDWYEPSDLVEMIDEMFHEHTDEELRRAATATIRRLVSRGMITVWLVPAGSEPEADPMPHDVNQALNSLDDDEQWTCSCQSSRLLELWYTATEDGVAWLDSTTPDTPASKAE